MKNKIKKIAVILLLALFVQSVLSQQKTVKFQFNVLDENGNFVSNLKSDDVQILLDKKNLRLESIESKTETSLDVMIMIDSSVSQEKTLPFEKIIAERIINEILISGKDKVAVVKFSGEISLIQDLTNDLSLAKKQLNLIKFEPPTGYIGGGIIASQTPQNSKQLAKGSTSIWDSIGKVTNAFAKLKTGNSRQLVILISDGVNTYGEGKLKQAVFSSLKNEVPIFAVGIGDDYYDGVDKKTLKTLTEQTGGIVILPKSDKAKDIDKQLATLKNGMRSSYEATFSVIQSASKDSLQEFEVKIINPELSKRKVQIIQPKGFALSDK